MNSKSLPESPEYVEFLSPYPEPTRILARGLRKRLLELLPSCIETVWDATNAVGVAFGFTEHNADHFIHLPVYTKHVNIGFSHGAQFNDPEGRLCGNGSRIRHIRLNRLEDLDDPYLHDLIRQAHESAVQSDEPVQPRTIIRVMEGPKRRPRPEK
ncbi:MAG: DUF1801 domain-containing protein [Fimbriimonadaceae bacterium]|nr:DUF1801 domain-containing protein [Fimbriimonadaceae bacterium]